MIYAFVFASFIIFGFVLDESTPAAIARVWIYASLALGVVMTQVDMATRIHHLATLIKDEHLNLWLDEQGVRFATRIAAVCVLTWKDETMLAAALLLAIVFQTQIVSAVAAFKRSQKDVP